MIHQFLSVSETFTTLSQVFICLFMQMTLSSLDAYVLFIICAMSFMTRHSLALTTNLIVAYYLVDVYIITQNMKCIH